MKILFLDFDGPVIPQRAYSYCLAEGRALDSSKILKHFDPCAVAMLNNIFKVTGARLVISSAWRRLGIDRIIETISASGIDPLLLHEDWCTEVFPDDTRANRILRWVEEHPDVTAWVSIDDEPLDDPDRRGDIRMKGHFVKVTLEDGMLHEHHGKMLYALLKDDLPEKAGCPHWPLENHNWLWCDGCKILRDNWLR